MADTDKTNSFEENLKNCCCEATRPLTAKERVDVDVELGELLDKIHRLTDFLYSKRLIEADLTMEMIQLLESQLSVMRQYASILQKRLAIWNDSKIKIFYHEVRN